MGKDQIIKTVAIIGNIVVFGWILFMMVSKGFPKSGVDITLTLLVLTTIVTSLISLVKKQK